MSKPALPRVPQLNRPTFADAEHNRDLPNKHPVPIIKPDDGGLAGREAVNGLAAQPGRFPVLQPFRRWIPDCESGFRE